MSTLKSERDKKNTAPLSGIKEQYSVYIARKAAILLAACVALGAFMILSISIGSASLSFADVLAALLSRFFRTIEVSGFNYNIVWNSRLPRVIMAAVSGIGLSVSGVLMQGITGNPLVSPFTVGISSSAALGASMAILFGVPFLGNRLGSTGIILMAFLFALACTLLVFLISRAKRSSPVTLVLAGTALTYFSSAIISVLYFFASEENLKSMVNWTFGSFTGTTWPKVFIVGAVVIACMPFCIKQAWNLNAMTAAGDEVAKGFGVNVSRVRAISLILSVLITATIISFTGVIGFVCLVAPHVTRFIMGGDHRFLLSGACMFGAILTVGSDLIGRVVLSPIILPISIVVSFVGVPLFLYLMLRSQNEYWQ
jgi:iron complex transport system permease protein